MEDKWDVDLNPEWPMSTMPILAGHTPTTIPSLHPLLKSMRSGVR